MPSRRILVPLDGSELAEGVLGPVSRLLHATGATGALLRVVRDVAEVAPATAALEVLRDRLIAGGVPATARVVVGEPAARIAEIAEECEASLVALATHARSGVARLALGSVAEGVVALSPVPVYLASPHSLVRPPGQPIRRILVPLDGSERSARVLPTACDLARIHGAELVLLHVVDLSWCHYPDDARPHERATGEAYLARELERLSVPGRTRIAEGAPADKILETIDTESADLVAIATHGRTGLARAYHGSVAGAVLRRARCPLLLVRSSTSPVAEPAASADATAQRA